MRCLIVVPSLMRAGAETQAVDLANGLSSKKHCVHLCSFEPQLDQKERLASSVRFHHVNRKSKYDLSFVADIAEIIDREDVEVVQGVMQFGVLFAWLAAKRSARKPPVVASIHTTKNRGLKDELHDRLIYRWILRTLPAVVFVCEYQRQYWIRKYPELGRVARVVYNGVDVARYRRCDFEARARNLRAELGISGDATVFACIAAFRPEKGHHLLIEAFSQLPASSYLILAGNGRTRRTVEAAVLAAGLSDRVHFLGNIPDVRPVIVASNATVLPSTAVETFSMAMLESMALEVPMIASRIGGLQEAIIEGETGFVCLPGDTKSLVTQMRFVVEHHSEVVRLGRAAANKVSQCFTFERMVTANEVVLADALKSEAEGRSSALS
jgi:glycosyltransferase involved in cell wall biosynthesis